MRHNFSPKQLRLYWTEKHTVQSDFRVKTSAPPGGTLRQALQGKLHLSAEKHDALGLLVK